MKIFDILFSRSQSLTSVSSHSSDTASNLTSLIESNPKHNLRRNSLSLPLLTNIDVEAALQTPSSTDSVSLFDFIHHQSLQRQQHTNDQILHQLLAHNKNVRPCIDCVVLPFLLIRHDNIASVVKTDTPSTFSIVHSLFSIATLFTRMAHNL